MPCTTRHLPRRALRACLVALAATATIAPTAMAGPISVIANPNTDGAWDYGSDGVLIHHVPNTGFIIPSAGETGAFDVARLNFCASNHWRNTRVRDAEVSFSRTQGPQDLDTMVISWENEGTPAYNDSQLTQTTNGAITSNPANSHLPRWMSTFWAGGMDVNTNCIGTGIYSRSATYFEPVQTSARLGRLRVEDLEGPSISAASAPTGWQRGDTVTATWTSTDNGLGDGIVTVGVPALGLTDQGAGKGDGSADVSIAGLADGTHTIRFTRAGTEWPTATVDRTIRIDRTDPAVPTTGKTSTDWASTDTVTVTATATDATSGIDHLEYQTSTDGGQTWSPASTGDTLNVTSEGETHVRFRSIDRAGNTSAWNTAQAIRVDRTAPTATITGDTPGWTNALLHAVTLTATDTHSGVDHLEYQTSTDNGQTWSPATTGTKATINEEGITLLRARATDNAGNTSDWGTPARIRIDRTAPTLTAPALPTDWQSTGPITGTITATDDTSGVADLEHQTSTDGGQTWSQTTTGGTITITRDGTTTIRMRARDEAGNTGAWVTRTVRLDQTAPTTSVPPTTGWDNTATTTITVTGQDPDSGIHHIEHETSTDGGQTWSQTTTGDTITITREGTTNIRARAVNHAGTPDAWVTRTVRRDTTAPTATLEGPDPAWRTTPATLTPTTSDDGSGVNTTHLQSREGSGAWQAVSSDDLTLTADQDREYRLAATDHAGNTSAWSAPVRVRIDTQAPDIDLTATQATSDSVHITLDVTDAASGPTTDPVIISYEDASGRRDVARTTNSAITITGNGLTEGPLTVHVTTRDNAGNTATASRHLTITRTAPAVTDLTLDQAADRTGTLTGTTTPGAYTATNAISVQVYRQGAWDTITRTRFAANGTLAVPVDLTGLPDGTYRLRIHATDALGNTTTRETDTPVTVTRHGASVEEPTITWTADGPELHTSLTPGAQRITRLDVSIETAPGQWHTLTTLTDPAPNAPLAVPLDTSTVGLAGGAYRLKITLTTAGGDTTSTTTRLIVATTTAPVATSTTSGMQVTSNIATGAGAVPVDPATWTLTMCHKDTGTCIPMTLMSKDGTAATGSATATHAGLWQITATATDTRGRQVTTTSTTTITGPTTAPPAEAPTTQATPHEGGTDGTAAAPTTIQLGQTTASTNPATTPAGRVRITLRARKAAHNTLILEGRILGAPRGQATRATVTHTGRAVGRTTSRPNGTYRLKITGTRGRYQLRAAGVTRTFQVRR